MDLKQIIKMQYIIYLIIFILTASCASLDDAGKVLRNEKIKTTDEFLIKKKEPLIMPPDLDEIPEPESLKNKKVENDDEKIKKILKMPNTVNNNNKANSSTENLIIDKIKKW